MIARIALATLCVLLSGCDASVDKASAGNDAPALETAVAGRMPLAVQTDTGVHRFAVEVARTSEEQEQGLMFRKSLAADDGMLFPMDPPRPASFWMKNTIIPLDMLFVRTDGTIAFIHANATPYSREPASAGIPVTAVLELRGGRSAELGIKEGDRLRWGRCVAATPEPLDALSFCPADAPARH